MPRDIIQNEYNGYTICMANVQMCALAVLDLFKNVCVAIAT